MVYVDSMNRKYGRMVMCHMLADTSAELLEMAKIVGIDVGHIQYPQTPKEHFDICLEKKKLALENGAKEVSSRFMVKLIQIKTHDTTYR